MAKVKCPKCFHVNPDGQDNCVECQTPLPKITIEAASMPPRQGGGGHEAVQFRRGQVVGGRYTVLTLIGRGGMGCIYKVHDNTLGEEVALKTLLPQFVQDKLVVERFFNEARIARRMAHPNIVRVHDIGNMGSVVYISMEFLKGKSLRAVIENLPPGQRLPIRQTLQIVDELCAALEYAHQYTVHRDIKPENVMVGADGAVKLMDFGISKLMANTRLTGASVVMGTPFYMSPEQLRNSRDVDARADIYSVGVMLYEILTGVMPTGVPKPASEMMQNVPPVLDEIVRRCVDPDPNNRFQNASELRTALLPVRQLVLSGEDLSRAMTKRGQVRRLPVRQVLGGALAALLAVMVGAGLLGVEARRRILIEEAGLGAGGPAVPSVAGFEEIRRAVDPIRNGATVRARNDDVLDGIREDADLFWKMAEREANSDGRKAIDFGTQALQYYLAIMLASDEMVFIPEGPVGIGGVPTHVPPFLIDTTEVTLAAYRDFSEDMSNDWRFPAEMHGFLESNPEMPVTMVAYYDAQAYAAARGKLLPTEAQWYRAAFGYPSAAPQAYPWGEEWEADGANLNGRFRQAAGVKRSRSDLTESGCWDMAGNVAEWTRTTLTHRADAEPPFPDFGVVMRICGASFEDRARPMAEMRDEVLFEYRGYDVGFRCVREIPSDPAAALALYDALSQPLASSATNGSAPEKGPV